MSALERRIENAYWRSLFELMQRFEIRDSRFECELDDTDWVIDSRLYEGCLTKLSRISLSCIGLCYFVSRYHCQEMNFLDGTLGIKMLKTKANTMVVVGSKCQDNDYQCSKVGYIYRSDDAFLFDLTYQHLSSY